MASSTFFFTILVSITAGNSVLSWSLQEDDKRDLELEVLKRMEIKRLKARIIEALDLTELPPVANTPSRLSEAAIKLLIAEKEPPSQSLDKLGSLLFFPTNNNFQCLWLKDSSCRRFEYRIYKDVIFSKSEFWFFKQKSVSNVNQTILTLCKQIGKEEQGISKYKKLLHEERDEQWLSISLPFSKELGGNAICSVEITGMTVADVQDQPFLKMTPKPKMHTRKRRSENDTVMNESCRPVELKVNFTQIGLGKDIRYPEIYYANVCTGYCLQSANDYETIMEHVYQTNRSLDKDFGRCWATCCKPKEYQSLHVWLMDNSSGTEMYEAKELVNMVVKSCSCG